MPPIPTSPPPPSPPAPPNLIALTPTGMPYPPGVVFPPPSPSPPYPKYPNFPPEPPSPPRPPMPPPTPPSPPSPPPQPPKPPAPPPSPPRCGLQGVPCDVKCRRQTRTPRLILLSFPLLQATCATTATWHSAHAVSAAAHARQQPIATAAPRADTTPDGAACARRIPLPSAAAVAPPATCAPDRAAQSTIRRLAA